MRALASVLLTVAIAVAAVPASADGRSPISNGGATVTLENVPPATGRANLHIGNYAVPVDYDPSCDGSSATHDCSGALNDALGITVNGVPAAVHLQAGSYYVAHQLNARNQQLVRGDGRGSTTILVDQGFDPAASGVFVDTTSGNYGPEIRDLAISFAQPSTQSSRASFTTLALGCTSGSGGTGCKYPPAILVSGTPGGRTKVDNVLISEAWDGISGGGSNTVFWLNNVEMSAFDIGVQAAGVKDFYHIDGLHFWNFGFQSTDPIFSVYSDGNTYLAQFGEVDGLDARGVTDFGGRISINSANFWGQFDNLMLDSNNATFEVTTNKWVQLSNVYATGAATGADTHCQIDLSGGVAILSNARMTSSSTSICQSGGELTASGVREIAGASGGTPEINITGGKARFSNSTIDGQLGVSNTAIVEWTGGEFVPQTTTTKAVNQTGGALYIIGTRIAPNTGAGSWTVPVIANTGTNTLIVRDTSWNAAGTNVGAISTTDSANVKITGNEFNGWTYTPAGTLGTYWPNGKREFTVSSGTGAPALPTCDATEDQNTVQVIDQAAPTGGGSLRASVTCTNGSGWKLGL